MSERPSQLAFSLTHPPQHDRDSFLASPANYEALAFVDRWPDWPGPSVVLSGPQASGKTHLAQIWSARAGATIVEAADLDGTGLADLRPKAALVVENVDFRQVPQGSLFHTLNSAREAGAFVLMTSGAPSQEWRVDLPDLQSRLRSAVQLVLQPPDDDLLRQVLVKLFADRQLAVDKAVIDFLLVRMGRSLSTARSLVEALDREALAAGQSITRPLASRVLAFAGMFIESE